MCRRVLAGVVLLLIGSPSGMHGAEPVSVKTLVERLSSDSDNVRTQAREDLDARCRRALDSLGKFEPDELAVQAKLREEARPLVASVVKLLESHDDDCRASAATLLATMGPDAAVARPNLLRIVRAGQEEAPNVWCAATLALVHVCPPDQAIGHEFLKSFAEIATQQTVELEKSRKAGDKRKGDVDVVDPVEYTSGFLGIIIGKTLIDAGRTQAELPTLLEMTKAKYPRLMRAAAISALQIIQREGAAAAPTLITLLQDPDPLIQHVSAGALLSVTNDATVIPLVIARSTLSAAEKQAFRKSALEFLDEQAERRERTRESAYLQQGLIRDALVMFVNGNSVHRRYALQMLSELWPGTRTALKTLLPIDGKLIGVVASRAAASMDRLPQLRGGLVSLTQIPALLPVELSLVVVASEEQEPANRKLPIRSASREASTLNESVLPR